MGGFTNADWTSPDEAVYVNDSEAVVFNLTAQTSFKVNEDKQAITCHKDKGPEFTNTFELNNWCISRDSGNYKSQMNEDGFDKLLQMKAKKEANESLWSYAVFFNVEVWQIKFID